MGIPNDSELQKMIVLLVHLNCTLIFSIATCIVIALNLFTLYLYNYLYCYYLKICNSSMGKTMWGVIDTCNNTDIKT